MDNVQSCKLEAVCNNNADCELPGEAKELRCNMKPKLIVDYSSSDEELPADSEESKPIEDDNVANLTAYNDISLIPVHGRTKNIKMLNDKLRSKQMNSTKHEKSPKKQTCEGGKSEEEGCSNNNFVSSMLKAVPVVECGACEESSTDESSLSSSSESETETEEELILVNKRMDYPEKQEAKKVTFLNALPEVEPNIENLNILLPNEVKLEKVGQINGVIEENIAIIKGLPSKPALNLDTVLFLEGRNILGKIYETFGPVCTPYYVVCFNEETRPPGLQENQPVYFAPDVKDFTSYVIPAQLTKLKGSDASWLNDKEPPDDALEYSDDEAERCAKHKRKKKRKLPVCNQPNPGIHQRHQTGGQEKCPTKPVSFDNAHAEMAECDNGWTNAVANRHQHQHHHRRDSVPPLLSQPQNYHPQPPNYQHYQPQSCQHQPHNYHSQPQLHSGQGYMPHHASQSYLGMVPNQQAGYWPSQGQTPVSNPPSFYHPPVGSYPNSGNMEPTNEHHGNMGNMYSAFSVPPPPPPP